MSLNFSEFVIQYEKYLKENQLVKRKSTNNIALRIPQRFSPNPKHETHHLYCKYQLLRYKPWSKNPLHVLGGKSDVPNNWINGWESFCQTAQGKKKIPKWIIRLNTFEQNECVSDEDSDDTDDESDSERQSDWMKLQSKTLCNSINNQETDSDISYWSTHRSEYTNEELCNLTNWLKIQKQNYTRPTRQRAVVDLLNLNSKQKVAYDLVNEHINNDGGSQLLFRLEGTAGTGKSHIINAWCNLLADGTFYVAAPTGRAAHNVNGVTLHSLLLLGTKRQVLELTGEPLKILQSKFNKVKYLVIDEYSMVGAKMFGLIERRLRQATGKLDTPFGGINIFLVGDTKQLPPVKDSPLWTKINCANTDIVRDGLIAFKHFNTIVTLNKIVRQGGDSQIRFREILLRLRLGESSLDDYKLLSTRIGNQSTIDTGFKDALYLMHSNKEVKSYNLKKLEELSKQGHKLCRIQALHNVPNASKIKPDELHGLQQEILLAKGARVMLTSNEWTDVGLTNGATGTVKHIIFEDASGPPNLPVAAILEMDATYNGPHLDNRPRCIVITPKTASYFDGCTTYERTQLPLKLAFAITIHKSQGMTLEMARVKLGKRETTPGLTFVALSRVRRLEDLLIDFENFECSTRICNIQMSTNVKEFDKETAELERQTETRYKHLRLQT